MKYSHNKNQIKQFLEGKLSKTEESKLLEWIKHSTENEKYFYQMQLALAEEVKNRHDKTVALRWQQLLERINFERSTKNPIIKTAHKYYRLAAPLAAAFFIGFVLATLVVWNTGRPEKLNTVQQKISAPYGARTQFMLPDSSIVWLNSGSELLFPSNFYSKRGVTLTGEAYFEVKKGEMPFLVSTVYGDVKVKGTSFNVKAYRDDLFETTLVKGQVNVLAKKGDEVALLPGYQAVYTKNGFNVNKVETEMHTSWTKGQLIFRKEHLPKMAHRLERWYNVKIELDNDTRLEDIHYTATIEMESFSEVLNLLKVTAPVDYTWDEKTRVIKLFYQKNNQQQ
ncbi:MAG: FecR family protein [Mariniphaga sp.]|jgi:ferric-dicitrate binding protein FerR (iron transport regulator)|nr:FecR family protein [Mariniphaga sp.]